MSMGIVAAGVGAVAAVGGSMISAKAQKDAAKRAAAAAEFKPFGINTGNVSSQQTVDHQGNIVPDSFTATLSTPLEQSQILANQGLRGSIEGGPGQGAIDQQFQQERFQTGTLAAGQGAQQFLEGAGRQDQLLANQQAQLGQGLQQFQQQGQQASDLVGQTSQFGAARGQELLGQDFGQLRGEELGLLRDQARPAEERAVNAKFQNLFSRGQLGTTGGANQIGALAQAQENADINRQLAATQTAQGVLAQNQATGQGLLGLGQQGAGLQGNLATQQLGGVQNTVAAQGNLGQQRLSNMQSLFGFGQDLRGLGIDEAKQNLGVTGSLDEMQRANLNLSGTFGGAQAQAGGNVANAILSNSGSPVGGALSSFGTGLLQQGLSNIGTGSSSPELQQITLPANAVRRS